MLVHLICRRDRALDPWARAIADGGVTMHRVNLTGPADVIATWRAMRVADVVHLILAYPVGKYQLVAALLARLAGRPLIVTHQLTIDLDRIAMSPQRRAFWRTGFRLYGRLARTNIAVSEAGRDLLVRRYGYSPRTTELIHNGADLSLFRPQGGQQRQAIREAIAAEVATESWPDDALLVVTVARLSIQKGLFDLVDAAADVVGKVPSLRFVIAGDGELKAELQQRVSALRLDRYVRFAGSRPRSELATWLGAADLFVLPSHFEGTPFSLVEAMAAGCPAVATRVGGVGEVIVDTTMGRLVPPHDSGALAGAIKELLANPPERRAMGIAARERATRAFDAETSYARTVATYEVPLSQGGGGLFSRRSRDRPSR